MSTFDAIYEGGVFHPIKPVALPEKCRVRLTGEVIVDNYERDDDMDAIYAILDRRHTTGISDLAARHNEHQP